ncbi:MAG: preprotein translocase subunit SecA [Alphaproteobacteria bacterium]|nr:preprotein translocase subunit SecA [Alphaproteobacteria bacterium]
MLGALARKVFGTANDRIIRSYQKDIQAINAMEPELAALTDEQLRDRTGILKARLEAGETLNDILPDAFATVREASKRTLKLRHFDVQLVGGMTLHRGMISEMKTGEGKTLVATLAAYLNALTGKGVHVVTVNDYLARRDSQWMGQIYTFLGMSVGCVIHDLDENQRKAAYAADITYGTNNEFGFDYLRDNMRYSREHMVQRPFNYAIIDEVDSILIDEARTPLIISGPAETSSELYYKVNDYIPHLIAEDFELDEKSRGVTLTEQGVQRMEEMLKADGLIRAESSLYDIENVSYVLHVNQALKAHKVFARDVDYLVKDKRVVIVDEFTGRMMEGRRYSEGLHQALEAKEGVPVQNENQTLASVTFQNYFRMYPKLAGMTGTAMTEADEFKDIYNLDVVEIPTNVDVTRTDHDDQIYRTAKEKYEAIIELIAECHARKQPVLVGTVSIEKSEFLAEQLKKRKIPHHVLNARYHEKEASIVAQAGRLGAVTIATNMAGRGTDIMLGGNSDMRIREEALAKDGSVDEKKAAKIRGEVEVEKAKVLEAGGLYVIGTERHESRRIDNQLRGRSGRQGDPGASKFFLSLEDDLMRIFGSEKLDGLLQKLGLGEGEAIYHPWMNKALEKAQEKVEARNYDLRKNLLKYDDVMNDQRKVIYEQRIELMEQEDVSESVAEMNTDVISGLVQGHIPPRSYPEQWEVESLQKEVFRIFGMHLPVDEWAKEEGIAEEEITARLQAATDALWAKKEEDYGADVMMQARQRILLLTLDRLWKDHLLSLDHLRQGIGLRAYGQRDPLNEYKQEAFSLFEQMLDKLREEVVTQLAHLTVNIKYTVPPEMRTPVAAGLKETREDPAMAAAAIRVGEQADRHTVTPIRSAQPSGPIDPNDPFTWGKVGRNEPCPCGSEKKYKHCHGAL